MASTEFLENFRVNWSDCIETVAYASDAPIVIDEHSVQPWITVRAIEAYWKWRSTDNGGTRPWTALEEIVQETLSEDEDRLMCEHLFSQPEITIDLMQKALQRAATKELVARANELRCRDGYNGRLINIVRGAQ